MAEAGFFPGVVYYFSYWLSAKNRPKVLSIFYLAVPFAVIFCSFISAPLLMMHGLEGLEGWQWLFIIEALPAVILGIYCFAAISVGTDVANSFTYIMEVMPKGKREVMANRWQFMFSLGIIAAI